MNQFLIAVFFFAFSLHDFHVTHTTLHFNEGDELIEITVKVAIDDMERALADKGIESLEVGTAKEHELAEQYIQDYIKQHLKISPNGQPAKYDWVGKEASKNLHDLYIYLELKNYNQHGKINSLTVENTFFIEMLSNQTNIMLIEFGKDNHNITLTKSRIRKKITLSSE